MTYSKKAQELRRCKATKANGEPCRAWAMWRDPQGRCMAHAGVERNFNGRCKGPVKTQTVACNCAAYAWPHRPGGGFCRWPDPPLFRLLTPKSTHCEERMRGADGALMKLLQRQWRRQNKSVGQPNLMELVKCLHSSF